MPDSSTVHTPEPDSPNAKRICPDCVGEPYLKNLIQTNGSQELCSYCDEENHTFLLDEVADLIERAFGDHYERTPTEPDGFEYAMSRDPELDYEWEREGQSAMWAICDAVDTTEEIAKDIQSILEDRHYDHELAKMGEECPFSRDSYYREKGVGHGEFLMLWHDFEENLKTKARFFSPTAKSILDRIFFGISTLQTVKKEPVVVPAGPDTPISVLYRARVFAEDEDKLKEALKVPWRHLGSPPANVASAGRMNARGISVFYGAVDEETALSEVRPPVGSKVALARFDILCPLRLLDLTALKSAAAGGSIFDPDTIMQIQRCNFLEVLSELMSRAVMPHEEESEYLLTQAVADFLGNHAGLDGIIFPSVQKGEKSSNVVLFHHAARVEEVELPKGSVVDVQLETTDSDGTYSEYSVWEKVPSPGAGAVSGLPLSDFVSEPYFKPADPRSPTLRIDGQTLQIYHVRAVTFDVERYSVDRHRY